MSASEPAAHPARPRNRTPDQAPGRDPHLTRDAGVIAVVVALSVSTFVLAFAALAVDLGAAYARKAELQSVADRLAQAGAKALPEVSGADGALAQMDRTLTEVCRGEALPGVCAGDGRPPDPSPGLGWATDGVAANGEVRFFRDGDGDGRYGIGDLVSASSDGVTALQVDLPPSTVQFGLADALGFASSATLTRSATARVGTALGNGILPFALTRGDLARRQFCVRDPAVRTPATDPPTSPAVTLTLEGADDGLPHLNREFTLGPPDTVDVTTVEFHYAVGPPPSAERFEREFELTRPQTWRVPLPEAGPGVVEQIWATGKLLSGSDFRSTNATITYAGSPAPGADSLCSQPAANRGFGLLARPDTFDQPAGLERNVRSGPAARLYPDGGVAGSLPAVDCLSSNFFSAPATTCLRSRTRTGFGDAVVNGLLRPDGRTPGRLIGDCGADPLSIGGFDGVDGSRLFSDGLGLVDPDRGGNGEALRVRLTGGAGPVTPGPGERGWITAKALRCPRLAVMPVTERSFLGGGRRISGFTYVWIDDDSQARGLNWSGTNRLESFRGYVVPPGFLPAVVAGSKVVGPFLGPGLPRQVQLIPDIGGPPT